MTFFVVVGVGGGGGFGVLSVVGSWAVVMSVTLVMSAMKG